MMTTKTYFPALFCLPVLFLCSCGGQAPAAADTATQETIQTPVTVAAISRDTMSEYIELNATAVFLLKSYAKANATGYLQSSTLKAGQFVSKGQPLFTVKTKEAESLGNAINKLDSSFRFSGTNTIRAGESGFVTQVDHQPGDYVQDGEQLAVISTSSSFAFLLNMPYELRPYIIHQPSIELVLPDGEKLRGVISGTMPAVDSAAQTQGIILRVQANHAIPENLVAKVRILKTMRAGTVSVPASAVLTNETQTDFWIMKLTDSVTAVKVPVKKGLSTKEKVEILSPALSDSDRILITGNYGLEDTAKVKIVEPSY